MKATALRVMTAASLTAALLISARALTRQQQPAQRQTQAQQEQPAHEQGRPQPKQQQPAPQQPPIQEEVVVRWWLVPVYAVDSAGSPVLNLSPEDLEVYIKNVKVDRFSLLKKEFQVTEAQRLGVAPKAPAQKKMVFLVFDAAFLPYNLLARAKAIADTVVAQSDKSAQYVLLSVEPYNGLKYIFGPTRDLKLVAKNLKKYVDGKKQDYIWESSVIDRNEVANVYPDDDRRNPNYIHGSTRGRLGGFDSYTYKGEIGDWDVNRRLDQRDKKRVASSYTSSLMTLDLILGYFKDYSKVIYFYSCGVPDEALLDRTERATQTVGGATAWEVYLSADTVAYDTLRMIGEHFNKSGAILFLVNPAGTIVPETDRDSGEQSLRLLATESGGRYFEGAEREISRQVNNMEGGYYEISFPDKPEYEGRELSFEIRTTRPEVRIYTVRKVGREKTYEDMTELEREVMVMNILSQGPLGQTSEKVTFAAADVLQDGDRLICQMPLPPELARTEWTVFKIARNFTTGRVYIEKDSVVPAIPSIQVRMKWRGKEFRHDLVLAHPKTGTIIVWR